MPLTLKCPNCSATMPSNNSNCQSCGTSLRDNAANLSRATRSIDCVLATPGLLSEADANAITALGEKLVTLIRLTKQEGVSKITIPPGTLAKNASPAQRREAAREFFGHWGRWAKG